MSRYGPQPELGSGAAPNEHLPAKESATLRGHDGAVLAVRLNDQGTYCLSCGKDRTVRLWNPHRGIHIKTYVGHGYDVRDVTVSSDNSKFASCGGDRQIFLWDVSTGNTIRKFKGHDGAVNAVKYSPNQDILVSAGYDQAVKVWDCRSRSIDPIQTMKPFRDSVTSVLVNTRSDIVAGSVDGSIRRFDARMGLLYTDELHHAVTCVASSRDGTSFLAACMDSCVRLVDREGGDLLAEYKGHKHEETKLDAAFTPSEGYVVACSEEGRVCYWELVDAQLVESFPAHLDTISSLAMHPRGECLVTSCIDGTIKVWI